MWKEQFGVREKKKRLKAQTQAVWCRIAITSKGRIILLFIFIQKDAPIHDADNIIQDAPINSRNRGSKSFACEGNKFIF